MSWGTIDWIEVVWTLAALPGLVLWLSNRVLAGRSLRAIKSVGATNGRLIIARYACFKANVLVFVQFVFLLIGVISLVRPANPNVAAWDWLRVVLTAGLLGAPASISVLGYKWRAVEQRVLALSRERLKSRADGATPREVTQTREVTQDARDPEPHDHEAQHQNEGTDQPWTSSTDPPPPATRT